MTEVQADVVVIGGGVGGVAAALAALDGGASVVLTEETAWLGGQLTSQAVPPDENPWIEDFGAAGSYQRFRFLVRDYYRRAYPMTEAARSNPLLNPGNGGVSRICHEPRVALAVIDELLAPHRASGRLRVLLDHRPVRVEVDGDRVTAVVVRGPSGTETVLTGAYMLDATELGDLLDLAGIEHVMGAESQDDTGEPHALPGPGEPLDQQAFTVCFAVEHLPGEDHVIDRPADYDFWATYQAPFRPATQLSWTELVPDTLAPHHRSIFRSEDSLDGRDAGDLWHFRRIVDADNFLPDSGIRDVTLVNWQAVDYWQGPLAGVDAETAATHVRRARQLSLSYLYWMQTEAPRHDGGVGYPGLRLRGDLLGDTSDGLAIAPYIRESRRIVGEQRIVENDVSVAVRGNRGAVSYTDSIGIGSYRIDLHPSVGGAGGSPRSFVDVDTYPFQIPLGALIPVRVENLLPAAKNIATTHVTNGCYRLHPVEWSIGEAAGAMAARCVRLRVSPRAVRHNPAGLEDFQRELATGRGVRISWPESVRTSTEYY